MDIFSLSICSDDREQDFSVILAISGYNVYKCLTQHVIVVVAVTTVAAAAAANI